MKKLTFLIVMVLLYSFSAIANSKEYEVDFNYSQIAKYQLLINKKYKGVFHDLFKRS